MLKRTTIYLTEELHRELKLRAAKEGTTITDIINKAINKPVAEKTEKISSERSNMEPNPKEGLVKERGELSGESYF